MTVPNTPDSSHLRLARPAQPIPATAYDGVELADTFANPDWRDAALTVIATYAQMGEPFTADDVREIAGEPGHANRWGALFRSACKSGLIVPTGRVMRSTRASRNAGMQREWIGAA